MKLFFSSSLSTIPKGRINKIYKKGGEGKGVREGKGNLMKGGKIPENGIEIENTHSINTPSSHSNV